MTEPRKNAEGRWEHRFRSRLPQSSVWPHDRFGRRGRQTVTIRAEVLSPLT
ncbi:hypothetical protein ACFVIM_01345 [Streptomyces sp. NPDC057638]|uniref:hypothetical protein n=1 Tax=Streptomyces sp. NPDC057638 TaxID=3346190 RepID=UPI00368849ED